MDSLARHLAQNILALRRQRGLTQQQLATIASVPRSTVTYLESGEGNPSLQNLARVSAALQVSLEELLAPPRGRYKLVKSRDVDAVTRGQGAVRIYRLLPDAIPGMHIDRMEFAPGARVGGVPHVSGTKEYLTCLQGAVTVRTGGQTFTVQKGDVLAFPGDQPHSYENAAGTSSVCVSVVVLAPAGI